MAGVHARYYTDPACPVSWASEPALRGLELQFAGEVEITYVMAGSFREFGPPEGRVRAWLQAAAASGMPVDPRIWWEGPPRSSHPACLAVVAASEQRLAGPMLRVLRVGLLARRRRLDSMEALIEAGREVAGLDLGAFRVALGSSATVERFAADLEAARRGEVPRLELGGRVLGGVLDPEAVKAAARAAGASASGAAPPGPVEALRQLGALATAEVAAVCDLPGPRAPAALWQAALDWRVRVEPVLTGELWALA